MKNKARGNTSRRAKLLFGIALATVLALGAMTACGSNESGNAKSAATDSTTMTTKTLVKTASNEMTLVNWDVSAEDSPLAISSDDPQYSEYTTALRNITGFNIENLTMQVRITEFAGAEIGATHENVKDNIYTIESLDAVIDGKTVTYHEGDFK